MNTLYAQNEKNCILGYMYTEKTFIIPDSLQGISSANINEHLKLYAGYVKHANLIHDHIRELSHDTENNSYEISELYRRFSFEYNGMKNHEYYFEQISDGAIPLDPMSDIAKKITTQFGSYEDWYTSFIELAMTRGVGWAVLWHDRENDTLIQSWVDEQHLGQLNGCQVILVIDMWEHAYVADYLPSGKKQYITDYMKNINWNTIAKRYKKE